ncbi:hypothetical protein [Pseudooceanicola algae]|nr:hypothetical protein [Pseudooceanicola algae]
MTCLVLAACAPKPQGTAPGGQNGGQGSNEGLVRSQPKVSGTAGVAVTPDGVRPNVGVGVSVCNNRSPFHVSLGGLLGPVGGGVYC